MSASAAAHSAPGLGQGGAAAPLPDTTAQAGFLLLAVLVVLLQFGPLLGLLAFRASGHPLWAYIGVLRDVVVVLLVVLAGAHALGTTRPAFAWTPAQRWAAAIIVASAAAALVASSGLNLVALNLRRLALMPLLFLAVSTLPLQRPQIERLLAWLVSTSLAVAVTAIGERLLGDALWTDWLELDAYTAANGLDRFGWAPFEYNGRYFSDDIAWLTGGRERRAIGSYLEPTTLAAGMAAALALGLARRARGHGSTLLVCTVAAAGLLTVSKGFALYLLLLLAWRGIGVPAPSQTLALGLGAIGVSALTVALGYQEGAFMHLAGVSSALAHLGEGHWLGAGVGELGNYSNDTSEVGSESGLGNAMAQVGVVAFLPLMWIGALARQALMQAQALADPGGPWLASWALFWTTNYVMSASSQGIGGNALGFLMLALYLHPNVRKSVP